MKMIRITSVVLIIAMLLTACATTPAGTEQPAAEKPEESKTLEPLKIGLIVPLTGANAMEGDNNQKGAMLAVKQINEAGGVAGRKLELVIEDDANDVTSAVNAAQVLLDKHQVDIIVGPWGSSPALAVMPLMAEYETPMVVGSPTNAKITDENNGWVFRTCSNEVINSEFAAARLVTELGFKTVGFMANNTDHGRGVVEMWAPAIEAAGGKVLPAEYHDASTTVNFTASLSKLRAAGADSIVMTPSLSNAVLILKQAKELNWSPKFFITTGVNENSLNKVAESPEIFEGLYALGYTVLMGLQDPEYKDAVQKFVDDIYNEYGLKAESNHGSSYDAIYTVAEALRLADGSTDGNDLREALFKVNFKGLRGVTQFDEKGQNQGLKKYMCYFKDGKEYICDFDLPQ